MCRQGLEIKATDSCYLFSSYVPSWHFASSIGYIAYNRNDCKQNGQSLFTGRDCGRPQVLSQKYWPGTVSHCPDSLITKEAYQLLNSNICISLASALGWLLWSASYCGHQTPFSWSVIQPATLITYQGFSWHFDKQLSFEMEYVSQCSE